MSLYRTCGKRALDILSSATLLVAAAPVLVLSAILIRCESAGSVLFRQTRFGRNGSQFQVLKFRTMYDRPRASGEIYPGNPEVTIIGRWLRRLKIDELPQLVNVLRGEMSLIGPRPGLIEQLRDLDENAKRRLLVRPGLTGLAQVNGNIYLTWEERWRYDAIYAARASMPLDLWIALRTIAVIAWGEKRFVNRPSSRTQ